MQKGVWHLGTQFLVASCKVYFWNFSQWALQTRPEFPEGKLVFILDTFSTLQLVPGLQMGAQGSGELSVNVLSCSHSGQLLAAFMHQSYFSHLRMWLPYFPGRVF